MHDNQKGIIVAVVLAILTILGLPSFSKTAQYDFLFGICVSLPTIYLGASLVGTSVVLNDKESLLELLGFVIWFSIGLYARMNQLMWYFGLAFTGHGLWDIWHSFTIIGRGMAVRTKLPNWYPIACVVYDIIVGAFLFTKL